MRRSSRPNRACLWRVPLRYQKDLALETAHHLQSRGGTRREQGTQGQSALPGHQPKTESTVDLRTSLLSAGRRGEQNQRIARRHADRPDQLLELLGQYVPGAADRGGVCADARDAGFAWHKLTHHARAQVSTLRERFLKIGAQVMVSVRRIVLHLPESFPYLDTFHHLALSLGARPG